MRRTPAAVLAAAAMSLAAGCSGGASTAAPEHRDVAAHLGKVPIPTAPAAQPTASAAPGRPTVLEMGAPVALRLPHGIRAVVTVLGPEQGTTTPGAATTRGTFRVRVEPTRGHLRVSTSDFSSRGETGQAVLLRPGRRSSAVAGPGRPRTLVLVGRYASGAAQVTYRHSGHLLAVWDFNIELD